MRILTSLFLCVLLAGCVFDGSDMRFRFVSSGQSVEDAAIVTQTLLGDALKALTPVNLRMYRSLGATGYSPPLNAGNIGFEWSRRSRIAPGLRPSSDIPVAEEFTRYELDIMNGATVVRTIVVNPNEPTPILWTRGRGTVGQYIWQWEDEGQEGNLVAGGSGNSTGMAWSQQVLHVGSDDVTISFTTKASETALGTNTLPYRIGLISESTLTLTNSPRNDWFPLIGFQRDIGSTTEQTLGLASNVNLAEVAPSHLVIKISRRGQVSLYQNPIGGVGTPLGPETVTIPAGRYRFFHRNFSPNSSDDNNAYEILRPKIVRLDVPSAVYYLRDVVTDFGSVPSTLTVRVYQISAVIGRGPYTEATFNL